MAEIGLVRFARQAREVAEAVVPPYRTKFSKHAFTRAAVIGYVVPDALRGLDFARGRSAVGRASRVAGSARAAHRADSVIPAKRRSSKPASGVRREMHENFPRAMYGRRSLIKTVFFRRQMQALRPRSRRPIPMHACQALLLGLAYSLYRLRAR